MEAILLILLIFLVFVFLFAIVVLLIQLRRRDVFKTTLASLMGMLLTLVGQSKAVPELNGPAKLHLSLGSMFSIESDTLTISTGNSLPIQVIAFVTIALLALVCILKMKDSAPAQ
jgi:hypothetical protein